MLQEKLRIDKNLAYNIGELQKYEDKQTQIIIKSLLIYFSFSYQTDLFGYGTLDPKDFSKKMNIDYASLFRKHPSPKQISNSPYPARALYELEKVDGKFSSSRLWDNYLENALYILSSSPLFENYKGSTGKREFVGIANYILIRDRRISFEPSNNGRNKKVLYHYKLDEMFENNLRRFFLQTKLENYLLSKSKGVEDFYLSLSNIYQSKKGQGITQWRWKLEDLTEIFHISSNLEIRHQKSKLKNKLKLVEKIMQNEIPGIEFFWDKGQGQRYAYVPSVKWSPLNDKVSKNTDYKTLDSVFFKHLKRNLYEIFLRQEIKAEDPVKAFYSWLWQPETLDVKIGCYVSTYALHNKVSYPKPNTLAKAFFLDIKKCKTIEDIEQCFNVAY